MSENNETTVPAETPAKRGRPAKAAEAPVKEAKASTIPPCPDEDPQAGDKTPAVAAWWFKHHPKAAAEKYRGRKFQLPESHE
jgi:hypothetical protein